MRYIFFFATPRDIALALQRFEAEVPVKFVQTAILPTADRAIYLSSSEISGLGISSHESGNGSTTYLVSYRDTKNVLYPIDCDDGRRRWALRNGDNEETVLFTPAGLWKSGSLLPGNMSTLHQTPVAQRLMRSFLSALKEEKFTKADVWWLGPGALDMLKAGMRLTQAEQASRECDLKWPSAHAE